MTTDPQTEGYKDGYAQGFLDGSAQGVLEGQAEGLSLALAQLRPAIVQLERIMERHFKIAESAPPDDVVAHSADVVILKDRR